jgi:hypothetical protein
MVREVGRQWAEIPGLRDTASMDFETRAEMRAVSLPAPHHCRLPLITVASLPLITVARRAVSLACPSSLSPACPSSLSREKISLRAHTSSSLSGNRMTTPGRREGGGRA